MSFFPCMFVMIELRQLDPLELINYMLRKPALHGQPVVDQYQCSIIQCPHVYTSCCNQFCNHCQLPKDGGPLIRPSR